MRQLRASPSPLCLPALAAAVFGVSGCSGSSAQLSTPSARDAAQDPAAGAAAASPTRVLIALEGEATVAAVRSGPWRVVRRTRVAAGPHNLTADPRGRAAAVTSQRSDRVTILEPDGRVR